MARQDPPHVQRRIDRLLALELVLARRGLRRAAQAASDRRWALIIERAAAHRVEAAGPIRGRGSAG